MTNQDDNAKLAAIIHADNTTRAQLIREYWGDMDRAERTTKRVCYLHLGLLHGMLDNARARYEHDLAELSAALDSVIEERDQSDELLKKATDTLLRIRLALGAEPEADLVAVVDEMNAELTALEQRHG